MIKNRQLKKRYFMNGKAAGRAENLKEKAAIEKEREKERKAYEALETARQDNYDRKLETLERLISNAQKKADKIIETAKKDASEMTESARSNLIDSRKILIESRSTYTGLNEDYQIIRKVKLNAEERNANIGGLEREIQRVENTLQ